MHAPGPYRVSAVEATSAAIYTNGPPAGAFRGFGVPQAAIATEMLMDQAADEIGLDRLEFRLMNALRAGDLTATGQRIEASVGLVPCLEALRDRWSDYQAEAENRNTVPGPDRVGVGIGCMWYGCGNTSMSNPSTMHLGLSADGRLTLYNGAVDIGQGTYTIMAQIAADALARRSTGCVRCSARRTERRTRQDVRLAPNLRVRAGFGTCRTGSARPITQTRERRRRRSLIFPKTACKRSSAARRETSISRPSHRMPMVTC